MLQQICCLSFWLTLSWCLLIMPSLTTNFVNAAGGGDRGQIGERTPEEESSNIEIETMFKSNGKPAKCLAYFKEVFDVEAKRNPYPHDHITLRQGSRTDEERFLAAKHDYPLARGQLERRISIYEMQQRMEDTFKVIQPMKVTKSIPYCSDYNKAWNNKWEQLRTRWSLLDMKSPKLKKKFNYLETLMDTGSRHPDQSNNDPGRTRLDAVWEALEKAANIRPVGFIGHIRQMKGDTDSTDLIEVLVTLTNEERVKIEEGKDFNAMTGYCQEMIKNSEVKNNAPFANILSALCLGKKDDDFVVEEPDFKDDLDKISKFIKNPENDDGIATILTTKDYARLRALNEKMKQSSDIFDDDDLSGKGLYDVANYYYQHKDSSNDKKRLWKLVKAIGAEIEFGRPRVFADILREKIEKIFANKSLEDSFSDITRIVLTRAPLDLADINEAYEQTNPKINTYQGTTLYDHLEELKEKKFENETDNGHMTIESYQLIIEWAVEQLNYQFRKVAVSTNKELEIRKYIMSTNMSNELHSYKTKAGTSTSSVVSVAATGHHHSGGSFDHQLPLSPGILLPLPPGAKVKAAADEKQFS